MRLPTLALTAISPIPALVTLLLAGLLVASLITHSPAAAFAQSSTPIADPSPDPSRAALDPAVAYLLTLQTAAGGFLGFSGTPDPATTTDAVFALAAAGSRGAAVAPALAAALDYLDAEGAAYATTGPGQAAKVALAAVAGGRDPARFAGLDLLAAMTAPVPAATPFPVIPGLLGDDLYDHALVLLALAATNQPVPAGAIDILRATQLADGSWAFAGTTDPGTGDSNTTALVVQALVATGHATDPMVAPALDYLKAVETRHGQFAYNLADPLVADANSTALAVQAIIAAGQDPTSLDWRNAARGLAAFQNVSGAFRYQDVTPGDNLLATLQAIPALAGIPLPVAVACPNPAASATPASPPAPDPGQTPCMALEEAT